MELVSRRRSPPAPWPAGAPHAFLSVIPRYPVFKVPGASYPPRPAASFRPRRKEIYYAHPLPRSRVFPAFFPGGSASEGYFPHTTWDDALLLPFEPCTHSLHKPRTRPLGAVRGISTREDGRRECDPAFRGASPQGDSLRPTATPLAMQRGRATPVRPASQIDR